MNFLQSIVLVGLYLEIMSNRRLPLCIDIDGLLILSARPCKLIGCGECRLIDCSRFPSMLHAWRRPIDLQTEVSSSVPHKWSPLRDAITVEKRVKRSPKWRGAEIALSPAYCRSTEVILPGSDTAFEKVLDRLARLTKNSLVKCLFFLTRPFLVSMQCSVWREGDHLYMIHVFARKAGASHY
jgi:hypothetical protein